eukprot:gb/GECG01003333.1/.p1 GENE.gb/GECG01003333.1/~~gb/GECG01003333.1/.p1  ORF type:complete len:306 (+),score=24.99 gb/GECG01003333.1/:1-918(+)
MLSTRESISKWIEQEGKWRWIGANLPRRAKKTLLLLHGLVGGSQEAYVKWMVAKAREFGIVGVVMNSRGCGETELKTPQCFSAAWTEDVRHVVRLLRARIGDESPLFVAGFSLGAGILSKYLCEQGESQASPSITAAACLSGGFDLTRSTKTMEKFPYKQTYNRRLASSLVKFVQRHERVLSQTPRLDLRKIYKSKTVREFDSNTIVPMFGFDDVWHYYAAASTGNRIGSISVPTLIVNAKDDAICDYKGLDTATSKMNRNLLVVHTEEGGHVAWAEGDGASWIDETCCEFFECAAQMQREGLVL